MFSPVGNRPPSVYWRRRIMVIGSAVLLVLLLALTLRAVTGGGDDDAQAGGPGTTTSAAPSTTPGAASSSPSSSGSGSTRAPSSRATSGATTSSSAPPARCVQKNLAIQAVVGKQSYQVGDEPVVELQVTNTGPRPCVQDLADRQVVLMVYNGESRVWGSHDCEVQAGTDDRTLPVDSPVRISITWSGRTSQVGCKGTRQRVGAGTYTLYAELSGTRGKADQFAIG